MKSSVKTDFEALERCVKYFLFKLIIFYKAIPHLKITKTHFLFCFLYFIYLVELMVFVLFTDLI